MKSAPLHGITIIDLTRVLAGPFATMILSDLGARVIKIEQPEKGDDARAIGPFSKKGDSLYFASLNRGKESISLNLKDKNHRPIFEELLCNADVLIENFRPDFLPSLGYDWEFLHKNFKRLIVASISGFGQTTSPHRQKPAYDIIIQALSGIMSITGEEGSNGVRVGTSIADLAAGLFASCGILATLEKRHRTGKGAHIDIAMMDCQIALLENAIARYHNDEKSPQPIQPIGNRHPSITPFASFKTKDRPIVIACGNDALFAKLCHCLHKPNLAEENIFKTNQQRTIHHKKLQNEIEQCLIKKTASEWITLLEQKGIPVGLMRTIGEVCQDESLQERNMFVTSKSKQGETFTMSGNPIKISDCPDDKTRPAPPSLKPPPA